jgi:recombination protein RecT
MTETKALTAVDELKRNLKLMEPQFKMALPSHIPVEKFLRVAQTAIQTSPHLLNADRTSLYAACIRCAQDGLLPDGRDAALVPFKDKVQYLPMVGGIIRRAKQSGEISSITSQLVYDKDSFRYWIDSEGEHIEHEPLMFGDRGNLIGVYALAKTKDGDIYIEVMTAEQVEAVKKSSRTAANGPWTGPYFTEMWRKTAIRRLSKRLPMSTELESVITADDSMYDLETKQIEKAKEATPEKVDAAPKKTSSRLGKAIKKKTTDEKPAIINHSTSEDEIPWPETTTTNEQEMPL